MNAMGGIAILTGVVYSIAVDGTYAKLFLGFLAVYHILTQVIFVNKKDVTLRKKLTVATWSSKSALNYPPLLV